MSDISIVVSSNTSSVAINTGVLSAPATTNASDLTSGTLPDARLSAAVPILVGGLIPSGLLPSYVDDVVEYANLAGFPATGEAGKIFVDIATKRIYRWSGSVYVEINAAPVQSVSGRTGAVTLTNADVGLGSVNNTSDASKPVSTDTQTALDGKAASSHTHVAANVTDFNAAVTTVAVTLPSTGLTITKTGDWRIGQPSQLFVFAPAIAIQVGNTHTRYTGKFISAFAYNETSWTTGPRITSLSFDDLVGTTGNFAPTAMVALTSLSLPALSYTGGTFSLTTMGAVTSLSVPELTHVVGQFTIINLNALTGTLSFPKLSYVGSSFMPSACYLLTTLSCPLLSYVGGTFGAASCSSLTTLDFPALSFVGSNFSPGMSYLVTTLTLPELSYVGGTFSPNALTSLTTLNLPKLSYVAGSFVPTLMTSLANFSLPTNGTLKQIGGPFTMAGFALTSASVDNIVQALASLDGTNSTILYNTYAVDLSGGTSVAPTDLGSTTVAGSSFVCSTTTCTVSWTGHGYTTGDVLRVSGITTATNANRYAVITVVSSSVFTYPITSQSAAGGGTATVRKAGASVKALVTRGVTLTTN